MSETLHELVLSRSIAAAPAIVWRVWTERTREWFAPKPYETPEVEHDLRAGGRNRVVMKAPDGTLMPMEGVFLEVEPGRRLVFTDAFRPGWIPQEAFMVVTVTLEPQDGGTLYTARVRHWSEEARARHEAMGFHEGWGTVAGQLAALAENEAQSGRAA